MKNVGAFTLTAIAAALVFSLASPSTLLAQPKITEARATSSDIVATAIQAGEFKTLAAALQAAGLVETLQGAGPFTVFAPNDAAFAKLPAGTVESLLKPENKQTLVAILTLHVTPARVKAADVVTKKELKTVNGLELPVSVKDGDAYVGGAKVIKADISASNGVIHVIDTVILPDAVKELSAKAKSAEAASAAAAAPKSIVEVAAGAGTFGTLVAAVKAAGLVETLQGPGPFTVFAPTDEAFAKLPAGTVESLLLPENKQKLAAILTYHVVPGRVVAADVVTKKELKTVQGQSFKVEVKDGAVFVDGAKVVKTDITASNGVIHVIDSVILPE